MAREYKQFCYVVKGRSLGVSCVTKNASYAIEVMNGGTDNEIVQVWDETKIVGVITREG